MAYLYNLFGINRAILYVILGRGGAVASGAITLFLISQYLTPQEQGYYFSFLSVIAFQVVLELGLGAILTQFVSHEMSKLEIINGNIYGEYRAKHRLFSIIRLALKWYSIVGFIVLLILIPVGITFFKESSSAGDNTTYIFIPWCLLVLSSIMSLIVNALLSIGDGLGYVEKIAKMRVYQSVAAGIISAIVLIGGFGLYAVLSTSISIVLIGGLWVIKNIFSVIHNAFKDIDLNEKVSWINEIFPMQWRIALSWFSGYFIFQIMNPISFKYYGAIFSGKFGMAMAILNLMVALSLAWITTKVPDFGRKIASNDKTVYHDYSKTFLQSLGFFILFSLLATFFIWLISYFELELANRVLSADLFAVLSLAMLANHIVACQATFVRSHKVERYTLLSLITALMISLGMYLTCNYLPSNYIIYSYALISWVVYVPGSYIIFRRFIKNNKYMDYEK
ncbi:hypothetical protein [Aeromonas enteropelogenes]|uniref:hypothetical protein n=1 Tax=Aeromonas enteropelogenes TaxID=29489 RepID=UPI002285D0BD|nr:hypothetical protein [Aeromonas enteropelogenes]MCZ0750974.1 hypothetical protein [Aeromonas enteropelogenes]